MDIRANFAAQSLVDEEIRAEIRRHEDTMKTLKIRRNTYCAVNQLPNEVLTSIFTMVQLLSICPYPPKRLIWQWWTPLLYVCQAWHEIIMVNPHFWSFISLNSNQAPRMLRLSKEVPLQVSVLVPGSPDERLWSLDPGHETTASWLLNTFRSSPNLQDVYIQQLRGPLIDPRSPRVALAYLHTLSITSENPLTLSIFDHLDAPALATLCAYYDRAEANMFTGRELSGLETIISQVTNPQITVESSEISLKSKASLSIVGYLHGADHSEHRLVKISLPRDLPADILRNIYDLPPLHNTSHLYLESIDADFLGPPPSSLIPSYTNVERIVFFECNSQLLQTLLKRNPEQHPPHGRWRSSAI
ncbi:hypothetical protein ONZ45_g9802 [Pleurotus djamor]|nr:hypothetical protein ONZ45_g9802 [Pleurotus djamor]